MGLIDKTVGLKKDTIGLGKKYQWGYYTCIFIYLFVIFFFFFFSFLFYLYFLTEKARLLGFSTL